MSTPSPLSRTLHRVWRQLPTRRRAQLGLLAGLMLASSVAEVVTIGALLPFIGVLTAPEKLLELTLARHLMAALGVAEVRDLLVPLTVLFGATAVLTAVFRLLLIWVQTRVSSAIGADFSIKVYALTLYQPYSVHVARHSSAVGVGIHKTQALVYSIISPVLQLASSVILLLGVLAALLAIDPVAATAAFAGFGGIYAAVVLVTRRRVARNSRIQAAQQGRVWKAINEGLGGIRDVILHGTQQAYISQYQSSLRPTQRAGAQNVFISASPRPCIEALGMILIATMACVMARQPGGIGTAIPVLGVLALGAQRLLPVIQNLYSAYIGIRGGQASAGDALDLLEQPLPEHARVRPSAPLPFNHALEIRELGFRYTPDGPWVLRDLNLIIPRGARVGFVGTTGSGKSTLLDILMGLLPPTTGTLAVDGTPLDASTLRAWQARIAHVPQSIFLADVSIAANIAFGEPPGRIDLERVRSAARQAQIADTIEAWPKGYDTTVGERGVRLSGGQRQRLGIARALYRKADVIILDEATSALDSETESAVMQAIDGLDSHLTLLIIAHRVTTLRGCDRIIELGGGGIVRQGTYAEMLGA